MVHDRHVIERKDWTSSSLGERLQAAIDHAHIGTNELGEASETSGATVSKLAERHENVAGRADTLRKLALALGVSPAWLAFGEGQATELWPGGDAVPPPMKLRDQPGWDEVSAEARRQKPYLSEASILRAGDYAYSELDFPDGLTGDSVARLALFYYEQQASKKSSTDH